MQLVTIPGPRKAARRKMVSVHGLLLFFWHGTLVVQVTLVAGRRAGLVIVVVGGGGGVVAVQRLVRRLIIAQDRKLTFTPCREVLPIPIDPHRRQPLSVVGSGRSSANFASHAIITSQRIIISIVIVPLTHSLMLSCHRNADALDNIDLGLRSQRDTLDHCDRHDRWRGVLRSARR